MSIFTKIIGKSLPFFLICISGNAKFPVNKTKQPESSSCLRYKKKMFLRKMPEVLKEERKQSKKKTNTFLLLKLLSLLIQP